MMITVDSREVVGNHIGGKELASLSGRTRPNSAPATGLPLHEVVESSEDDVNLAVDAAQEAQQEWARFTPTQRRTGLLRWADNLRDLTDEIATLDAHDSGSPVTFGKKGLLNGIEHLEHFAGLGYEVSGETLPISPGNLHMTVREPYGVVGILTPFNHPSFFPIKLSAPALAAGNAVVIKPSELTPMSVTLVAEAAREALPDGLINVVQGGPDAGQALVAHPRTLRLHLTGGVSTGLAIQQAAAASGYVKKVSLELGGKNPLIVFPDIDPAKAAEFVVRGMNFGRQGQSCGSTSRLFVHSSLAPEVSRRVVELVAKIKLGLPEHPGTAMGSMVSHRHQKRVLNMIRGGVEEGAEVLIGGGSPQGELAAGAYVEPTVLGAVRAEMHVAREEIFGPVLSIITWDDESDMIEAVNATEYGLTASVMSNDITMALRTASKIESGYVWVNGIERRWLGMPFGGYKNSGLGHEHSRETMLDYTRQKSISIVLADQNSSH